MKRRSGFVLALALFGSALASAVQAQAADIDEKEALTRLAAEVRVLEQLISAAERGADPGARVAFNYEQFRRDLSMIGAGIDDYLHGHRQQPRQIKPIDPNYVRLAPDRSE